MSDRQIVCPKCRPAIRSRMNYRHPLLAITRKQFEQQPAQQKLGFTERETPTAQAEGRVGEGPRSHRQSGLQKASERTHQRSLGRIHEMSFGMQIGSDSYVERPG